MKFEQYIQELAPKVEQLEIPAPFNEIDGRTEEEVGLLLSFFVRFFSTYYEELKSFESLDSLFFKNYIDSKQNFFSKGELLKIISQKNKIFDAREDSYFLIDEKVNDDSLDAIYDNWLLWVKEVKTQHEECQTFIREKMVLESNVKSLSCLCTACFSVYRAKVRDLAFDDVKNYIDHQLKDLEDRILNQSIDKNASLYLDIKKYIDKSVYNLRKRLKPSSLRRLEKQLKDYVTSQMGIESPLGKLYQEKICIKINTMLLEKDMKPDLANEDEIKRFFSQLGLGIWKFEKALEKEISKFITAVMSLKRKDISSKILTEYLGEFWLHSQARKMKRKIIYHMGPTNSGKTYHAIQALSKAKSGCYLAPLRLLAGELYDTLNEKGVPTSLLTGEEVIETPESTHYSSTIEMAKLSSEFECCVIDEIQMITDPQRGWAWTRALVGMCAPEIHVCGDPSVLNLIKEILKLTGDELEVVEYQRMTKLLVEPRPIRLTDLKRNDALIVFSRKNALKYKADLESLGFNVSIVYGRLSPEVRREQARKFDAGETDIIVSTDAIAMGMNLPVERIVFSTLSKYFNAQEYFLTHSEIKQIAGRAGRFNRFPTGYVNCLMKVEEGTQRLREALDSHLEQAKLAMVGPDLDIFHQVNAALSGNNLPTLSLTEFLMLFNTMTFRKPFYCVELKEMIEVAEMVEAANEGLMSMSDAEIFGFACAPVNLGQSEHVQYFNWIVNNYAHQVAIKNELIDFESQSIDYLEMGIKSVELYQWLARHFGGQFFQFDEDHLLDNKSKAIDKLNDLLSEKIMRSCSSCGVNLPDKFEYNICEECFSSRRFRAPRRENKKTPSYGKTNGSKKKSFDSASSFKKRNSQRKFFRKKK